MAKSKSVQFNCFSPPVMVATLIAESCMAIYTVWRYKLDTISRLAVVTLLSLASFQLAEFFVCTGYGLHAEQWSRLGFIMITALPPLGIHEMHVLAGKQKRKLVYGSYALMGGFQAFFLTYRTAFIGHQCTGNYVIFQLGNHMAGYYGLYYYGLLAIGIGLGAKWANEFVDMGKKGRNKLECVRGLIISYLIFLVPTALANTIKPESRHAIPSVMCGFAVLYALTLTLYILPRAAKIKEEHQVPNTPHFNQA
jgi:hypothetical protein